MTDAPPRGKIKALEVGTPQGASGRLLRESQYIFNYHEARDRLCEISLLMPLRAASYASSQPPTENRPASPGRRLGGALLRHNGGPWPNPFPTIN